MARAAKIGMALKNAKGDIHLLHSGKDQLPGARIVEVLPLERERQLITGERGPCYGLAIAAIACPELAIED